jgi:hypothetical protein
MFYQTGDTLADHSLRSEKGGASKVGVMTGDTLADHKLKCEAAGNNGALISQAAKDRHELLLMVANGFEGDTETWTCEASRNGNAVHYLFHTTKTGQEPIRGVRKFVWPCGTEGGLGERARARERDRQRKAEVELHALMVFGFVVVIWIGSTQLYALNQHSRYSFFFLVLLTDLQHFLTFNKTSLYISLSLSLSPPPPPPQSPPRSFAPEL